MDKLITELRLISDKYGGTIITEKGKWYTLRNYQPKFEYIIQIKSAHFIINVYYDFIGNEFSTSGVVNTQSITDRYNCSIFCTTENDGTFPEFYLRSKTWWEYYFTSGIFKIKCKDLKFVKQLKKDQILKSVCKLAREMHDFEPIITGNIYEPKFALEIHYGTSRPLIATIDLFLHWLIELHETAYKTKPSNSGYVNS